MIKLDLEDATTIVRVYPEKVFWGYSTSEILTVYPIESLNGFNIGDRIRESGTQHSCQIRFFGVCDFDRFGNLGEEVALVDFAGEDGQKYGYIQMSKIELVDDKT